jgi:DNA modification methylase
MQLDSYIDSIVQGSCLEILEKMSSECIDTIATSPPYWGLRDYGEETKVTWNDGWYGQLGLEPTLELYLSHLLQITAELKRVLKPTGIMFWNHGDNYASGWFTRQGKPKNVPQPRRGKPLTDYSKIGEAKDNEPYIFQPGIIPVSEKCLCLQNYRLILRMIDEQGWILRNTIVWSKPNHMPSSVKDRFTSSYDPIFMLVKSKKYWFDLDAVRVPSSSYRSFNLRVEDVKRGYIKSGQYKASEKEIEQYQGGNVVYHPLGKNPGDVWTIPTQPFPEAHFAVYPEKLIEPMIRAGCPAEICKKCGKARERITKTDYKSKGDFSTSNRGTNGKAVTIKKWGGGIEVNTIGWTDCGCNAGFEPGIVLDPFAGAGTTCVAAKKLGRHYIGIELNKAYCQMAEKRISKAVGQAELSLS